MEDSNYQYKHFKALVPENKIFTDGYTSDQGWRYFDYGPRSVPPLLCLCSVAVTCDAYFKQIMALTSRGYRVIAVDWPPVWQHQKWITCVDQFLDNIKVHQVHLYGTGLGGFLGQLYAQNRPRRVLSLVLSNTFLSTHLFHAQFQPWCGLLRWTPDFVLKRLILAGVKEGSQEPLITDAIDFVAARLEQLDQEQLASRMVLTTLEGSVGYLSVDSARITIMDSLDQSAVHAALGDAVCARYPKARKAFLKSGGDFPFLSRADEVDLHLLLHLRSVQAERIGPDMDTVPVSRFDGRRAASLICRRASLLASGSPSPSNEGEGMEADVQCNESDGMAEVVVKPASSLPDVSQAAMPTAGGDSVSHPAVFHGLLGGAASDLDADLDVASLKNSSAAIAGVHGSRFEEWIAADSAPSSPEQLLPVSGDCDASPEAEDSLFLSSNDLLQSALSQSPDAKVIPSPCLPASSLSASSRGPVAREWLKHVEGRGSDSVPDFSDWSTLEYE